MALIPIRHDTDRYGRPVITYADTDNLSQDDYNKYCEYVGLCKQSENKHDRVKYENLAKGILVNR